MKRYDALVIGASLGGLAAAALLTQAGRRVAVLEQQAAPSEPIGPIYALDPLVLSRLRLTARGLRFDHRDLPLGVGLAMLGREMRDAALVLDGFSSADSRAWKPFRQEVDGLARLLRRWWWSALEEGFAEGVLERQASKEYFARLSLTGADAFLRRHFQSDALIAALLFDASAGGLHVSEPGSALALVWRAAQEVAGLQGASAMPAPGTLIWSLIKAAGAADFRCYTRVTGIASQAGAVCGLRLASGEELEAPLILSSLTLRDTMALSSTLETLPPASGIGEARLLLSFRQKIAFPMGRMIQAERSGMYADAHEAARAGRLGAELPMELAPAEADASGVSKIAVTVRPVPAHLNAEDRVQLAARAVRVLSHRVPGAAALLSGVRFAQETMDSRASLGLLLAPPQSRVRTKIAGLYLCGAAAEPLPCMSGRAARIATALALKGLALKDSALQIPAPESEPIE